MDQRRADGEAVFAAWNRAMHYSLRARTLRSLKFEFNGPGCEEARYDMDKVRAWAVAVIPDVKAMLLNDYHSKDPDAATFRIDPQGSIWCDVSLTGHGKTKKTRLCLTGIGTPANIENFRVMIDPTFDETW